MARVVERFLGLEEQAKEALSAVESDRGASPVLVAVVQELDRKVKKAYDAINGEDEAKRREAVVEVEQAADSAKAAAEADAGAFEETRRAVLTAHDTICVIKTKY